MVNCVANLILLQYNATGASNTGNRKVARRTLGRPPRVKQFKERCKGGMSSRKLWMDEIRSHHFETMVETIKFVGIYVGETTF